VPAILQREERGRPNCPWKSLPLTVCQYACFHGHVTVQPETAIEDISFKPGFEIVKF
jgi:hypothetical protein